MQQRRHCRVLWVGGKPAAHEDGEEGRHVQGVEGWVATREVTEQGGRKMLLCTLLSFCCCRTQLPADAL